LLHKKPKGIRTYIPLWVALVKCTGDTLKELVHIGARMAKSYGQCKELPRPLARMSEHEEQHS